MDAGERPPYYPSHSPGPPPRKTRNQTCKRQPQARLVNIRQGRRLVCQGADALGACPEPGRTMSTGQRGIEETTGQLSSRRVRSGFTLHPNCATKASADFQRVAVEFVSVGSLSFGTPVWPRLVTDAASSACLPTFVGAARPVITLAPQLTRDVLPACPMPHALAPPPYRPFGKGQATQGSSRFVLPGRASPLLNISPAVCIDEGMAWDAELGSRSLKLPRRDAPSSRTAIVSSIHY